MAPKSDRYPVFRLCLERHFSTWSSLQLALREVMPGPIGSEFCTWLLDAQETFFYENDDLYPDEVTEWLAELLNTELDTRIEDGSLELVAEALCQAFRACAAGRQDDVTAELARLPAPADLARSRQAAAPMDDDDDGGGACAPAPAACPGPSPAATVTASDSAPSASASTPEDMVTDDGWTTVVTKRRR